MHGHHFWLVLTPLELHASLAAGYSWFPTQGCVSTTWGCSVEGVFFNNYRTKVKSSDIIQLNHKYTMPWLDNSHNIVPSDQKKLSAELKAGIYIMISQNIRYLLWNRGFCRSLNNTYPIFLIPCIRCTNHLCDSCDLTDVNPHFIPSLLRKIKNVDLLWRHRY